MLGGLGYLRIRYCTMGRSYIEKSDKMFTCSSYNKAGISTVDIQQNQYPRHLFNPREIPALCGHKSTTQKSSREYCIECWEKRQCEARKSEKPKENNTCRVLFVEDVADYRQNEMSS